MVCPMPPPTDGASDIIISAPLCTSWWCSVKGLEAPRYLVAQAAPRRIANWDSVTLVAVSVHPCQGIDSVASAHID